MTDRIARIETSTHASRIVLWLAVLLVLLAFALPAFVSRGLIKDLFMLMALLTLAQCWNLLAGYGGLVSVGQQAFVGLGAYAVFACISLWGVNPLVALVIAGIVATLFAVPAGFFIFRLDGAYFAIGTWVMAEVARLSVSQWKQFGGGTGTSLPRDAMQELWGLEGVASLFGVSSSAARDILLYWIALTIAVVTMALIYWVLRHRLGLALSAVRDNPQAAGAVGVGIPRIKWMIYISTAFATGLTGALIFLQKGRISPDSAFNVVDWTAFVIFIVVIGGIGSIEGPIVGVLIFFFLQNFLADFGTWYLISLGAAGIVTMIFAPRGLWGLLQDRRGISLFPTRRRLTLLERNKT